MLIFGLLLLGGLFALGVWGWWLRLNRQLEAACRFVNHHLEEIP